VAVHRLPAVALLATGDEVVPPESEPAPGQLRDSHTDFLLAATRLQGIRAEPMGIAPDRIAALRPLIARGLEHDVLLLSGGVSMGEFDLVEGVLDDLGCETVFDGVAIQPGKPLVFATHRGGIVFGLPGNPASVMVNFWLFVRPALRILAGHRDSWWGGAQRARLAAPLPGSGARDRFVPAEVSTEAGRLLATPFPPKGSHDLEAYARGNGLVRIEAGSAPRGVGEACEVLPFGDLT
jgi:molybdopterin molybdotransferase